MKKLVSLLAVGIGTSLSLLTIACSMGTHFNTVYSLTVNSTNPASGVSIAIAQPDVNGAASGTTSLTRTYFPGTTVTLTAPATASGNSFSSWTGCTSSNGNTCTVTVKSTTTVTAAYVTPQLITPAVTVTPSPASITTAQSLSVTVSVSEGNGNPTPTGSVVLTSGSYTSAAATLSSGSATVTVPAGALATGTDTLTATYTPDTASSATYNSATGTGTVTVTSSTLQPTVTLAADPTSIASGASSTLTWSSTNATSCTASGGWTGAEAISGTQSVSPTLTTSYTLTCTGAGGSASATATVAISAPSGSGATLVFSFPDGFIGSGNVINLVNDAASLNSTTGAIEVTNGTVGQHEAGAAWYIAQQNIQSFTTDFTFQQDPSAYGMVFCIQNSNSATNPNNSGIWASADANGEGYGVYDGQTPIGNSMAIKFDLTGANGSAYLGTTPNSTGLYINGGPLMSGGFIPEVDLNPSGIDLHSGDVMAAHIVYDGSILTMTLRDTVTNGQFRYSWPVDIPAIVGGNSAWIGFGGGTIPAVAQSILTWTFWEGYNSELPAPTFGVSAGSYTSAQTVSIGAIPGATIYYTINGQQPTTSSTQYTGPITVSSSEVIEAIAVETGYTDSPVAVANYQIAATGTPLINFPSGFASASNIVIPTGSALFSGSNIQLTNPNASDILQSGAAWYAVPVNVQSFTTNFTIQPMTSNPSNVEGITFTIQNQNPASSDSGSIYVSGGPYTVGLSNTGLGYQGILNSVAVIFDLYEGSGNLTGLYTNGAAPTGSSVSMSSSGVSLQSNHPLDVTLNYNGTTLAMTVEDTVTNDSFSTSWPVDIPATVGGNTAYVGFTSSTGWYSASQNILSWTYANNE